MVEMQGGDTSYILSPETFPVSPVQAELKAQNPGYLTYINTEGVGTAAGILGAGRSKKRTISIHVPGSFFIKSWDRRWKPENPLPLYILQTSHFSMQGSAIWKPVMRSRMCRKVYRN